MITRGRIETALYSVIRSKECEMWLVDQVWQKVFDESSPVDEDEAASAIWDELWPEVLERLRYPGVQPKGGE